MLLSLQLSASVAGDLFKLFDHRSGSMVAPSSDLILAFSMVSSASHETEISNMHMAAVANRRLTWKI